MKKFEGWRTEELQFVATLLAGREMIQNQIDYSILYNEIIREIRNRRVAEELFQMKLKGIEEEQSRLEGPSIPLDRVLAIQSTDRVGVQVQLLFVQV